MYSNPKGNVIDSIANDSIKDNYVILYILKTEKEYFYVDAVYTQDLIDATYAQDEPSKRKQKAKSHLGWIEKKGNLYIQLVGYADNVVFLYDKHPTQQKLQTVLLTNTGRTIILCPTAKKTGCRLNIRAENFG